jgi:hypothetical protein
LWRVIGFYVHVVVHREPILYAARAKMPRSNPHPLAERREPITEIPFQMLTGRCTYGGLGPCLAQDGSSTASLIRARSKATVISSCESSLVCCPEFGLTTVPKRPEDHSYSANLCGAQRVVAFQLAQLSHPTGVNRGVIRARFRMRRSPDSKTDRANILQIARYR